MSLMETDYPNFEIIFVDNGSSDGGLQIGERILDSFCSAQLMINERNLGFTATQSNLRRLSKSGFE